MGDGDAEVVVAPQEVVKVERSGPTLGEAVDRVLEALEPLDQVSREAVVLAACYKLGIRIAVRIADTTEARRSPSG